MRKSAICLLFAGTMLAAPMAANASLIGQTVNGSLATNQGPISTQFTSPAVVGPGAEFFGQYTDVFSQVWGYTVDIGADTITVGILSSNNPDNGNEGSNPLVDISLSGFTGLGPMGLQSYSCVSGGGSCGAFGPGPSVARLFSDGTSFSVGFDVVRSGETYVFGPALLGVPEPGVWALMLGGFGLAGVALRRRSGLARAA
jgi:hypothetical protein